jgi:hypothetical protein
MPIAQLGDLGVTFFVMIGLHLAAILWPVVLVVTAKGTLREVFCLVALWILLVVFWCWPEPFYNTFD